MYFVLCKFAFSKTGDNLHFRGGGIKVIEKSAPIISLPELRKNGVINGLYTELKEKYM
jgi:hypothetical protein